MDGRIITEGLLTGLPSVPGEDTALFYPDPPGEKRFYILTGMAAGSGDDGGGRLFIFGFEQEHWNLLGEQRIPRTAPVELRSLSPRGPWSGSRDTETLFLVSPDSLILCDTGSSEYQTMEMQNYAGSVRLNGLIYLAVSSGNGIGLYRIEE
jgi:hypothetical protein